MTILLALIAIVAFAILLTVRSTSFPMPPAEKPPAQKGASDGR